MILLLLIAAMVEAGGVGLVFALFQALSAPDALERSGWLADLHQALGAPAREHFLYILCGGLFGFFVAKNGISILVTWIRNRFIWINNARIINQMLEVYLAAPYAFHLRTNSATLIRNLTHSVAQFFTQIVMALMILTAEALVTVAIAAVLLANEPVATIAAALVLGVPMVLFVRYVHGPLSRWGKKVHVLLERALVVVNHALGGIREIKILRREESFLAQHREIVFQHAHMIRKASVINEIPRFITEILAVGALLMVTVVIVGQGRPLLDVLPVLGLFGAAAFRLMPSVNRMSGQANTITYNLPFLDSVQADLIAYRSAKTSMRDRPAPISFSSSIELQGVSYSYESTRRKALEEIDLTIRKGESLALVGRSGSGKSTLAAVILGLLPPDDGCILVDGKKVDAADGPWTLRAGVVPQDVVLIDDSLRRNIAFGMKDAEIDENRVVRAVSVAQLEPFVESLSEGLDTIVGERGARVSGGQRQRIAIARALYDDPDVLVMDEATSSLDPETETQFVAAISAFRSRCTLLVIAHRMSTIRECDRIAVLHNGRLADLGTFDELRGRCHEFRRMLRFSETHQNAIDGGVHDESGSTAVTRV